MPYGQGKHGELIIVDFADHAKIANSISPKAGQLTRQGFTEMTRVFAPFDPVVEPINDSRGNRLIQFAQLFLRKSRDFNAPGQALS